MAHFLPFKGILPNQEMTSWVVSRPFDNYSKAQVQEILHKNPDSFLNVIVPSIPNEEDKVPYEEKLRLGKETFNQLLHKKVFHISSSPGYYIYRQTQGDEQYTGIIGAISIDDCIQNIVKPHEQTLEHKEEKLKEYLKIIDINAEPVVISYKADHEINDLVDELTAQPAYASFDYESFGHHELWEVNNLETIQKIQERFSTFNELYIADGHHRTASSVLYGEEMRKNDPGYQGNEAYNYFMAMMFPHHQIRLREFNRLVKDLNGYSSQQLLQDLQKNFEVIHTSTFPEITDWLYSFGMYVDKTWYHLVPKDGVVEKLPEDHQLPTQVLTDLILSPALSIHDLRKDKRIAFIGGKTDHVLLEEKVNSGDFAAAFVVNKISIPLFKKFADNGWFMPPKSTYFEPKLLSGLVVYSLKEDL
jgi:uncharacterized protein (DUF1015 family)